jgi:hypothetical protein
VHAITNRKTIVINQSVICILADVNTTVHNFTGLRYGLRYGYGLQRFTGLRYVTAPYKGRNYVTNRNPSLARA